MMMVRKDDHLSLFGQLDQATQGSSRSVVIEVDKYVVNNEGNWLAMFQMVFDAGQPECEKKLVPRSIGETRDGDARVRSVCGGANSFQNV